MVVRSALPYFLVLWLALVSGCTRLPTLEQAPIKANTPAELHAYLRTHKPDVGLFRLRGPFAVSVRKDREIRLSPTEHYEADLYLSAPAEKLPLVIFLHGYDSSKEAHAQQAMHVASWGMHSLSIQLPKKGAWAVNGRTLERITRLIQRSPGVVDPRIDASRIVLAGHSFGGSAVAVALGAGAPALGGILLDPAAVGRDLPKFLQQIRKPVMVLGADEEVSYARNRELFYRYTSNGIAEVSIRDAGHEDAQYPSEYALQHGSDPYTTEESQIAFLSALTSAALSLTSTGTFEYAWTSFGSVFANGKFYNARRK